MSGNKVEICGVDTSTLPVLKNVEMQLLFREYQAGDISARDKLMQGNFRLVLSIVRRFRYRSELLDDLFQVGCIGLIKSIDNFDLSHNVKFSTYAVPMIIGEIKRYLRDNNSVRVARSLREIAYKVLATRDVLAHKNAGEPNIAELAEALGISKQDIIMAMEAIQDPVSIFDPVYHDGGEPILLLDQLSDNKTSTNQWADGVALKEGIKRLNPREQDILSLRFWEGKTQTEVAEEIGISQAQVSRLEKSAVKKINKFAKE